MTKSNTAFKDHRHLSGEGVSFDSDRQAANPLYPVFMKLTGKRVLLIGGGSIAAQKLRGLIHTDAQLEVIAPTITDEVRALRGDFPHIRYIKFTEREYEFGDELEAFLVIAATDLPELNRSIANRCRDQMILVNAVDDPENCDFYVPSLIETGSLKIAISTNGKAPSVAQRIRKDLAAMIAGKYADIVDIVHDFKQAVKDKIQGLNTDTVARRSKLIRWFTERQFQEQKRKARQH